MQTGLESSSGVARQGNLRASNLSLVARQIYASRTPMARADVAKATGMTRSTASRMVDELVAAGIVAESDPVPSNRRGRPSVPLSPHGGTLLALGLEINVGHSAARLVDLAGAVVAEAAVGARETHRR